MYFFEVPKMKNVKNLLNATAMIVVLAVSSSALAVDLVEVESVNNAVLVININTELVQSLKEMVLLLLNITTTTDEIIMAQLVSQYTESDVKLTFTAYAE